MQNKQILNLDLNAVNISQYKTSDYLAIAGIYLRSRQQNFSWQEPDDFKLADFDVVLSDDQIWIASYQAIPLGYVSLFTADRFLHHLFIDPLYQRCGLGQKLLKQARLILKDQIYLKCLCANQLALVFYQHQGFQILSRGEDSDGDYFLLGLIDI